MCIIHLYKIYMYTERYIYGKKYMVYRVIGMIVQLLIAIGWVR